MVHKKVLAAAFALPLVLSACGEAKMISPAPTPAASAPATSATPATTPAATTPAAVTPATATPAATAPAAATEKTITKKVTYVAPPGNEEITISLTTENGIVESVSVTPSSENPVSKKLQSEFASAVSSKVVGKKLADIKDLGTVAGASLTTGAFKKMVAEISA